MNTGADAMPVPDRLRARWRMRGTASDVGDPSASVADDVLLVRVADAEPVALTLEDGYVALAQQHRLTAAETTA
jgi:hypothetical protein